MNVDICRAGPLDADVESADVDALEHDLGRIEDTDSALAVAAAEIERLRRMTISVAAALTLIPFVSDPRMEPSTPPPSMVVDLVMVTVPKPSESSTEMTPAAAVLLIAPAKGIARCRATARVGVVTDTHDPGAHRLRMRAGREPKKRCGAERTEKSKKLAHVAHLRSGGADFASAIDSRQRLVRARAGKRHGSDPSMHRFDSFRRGYTLAVHPLNTSRHART